MRKDLKIQLSNSEDKGYRDFLKEKIDSFNYAKSEEYSQIRDKKNIKHFNAVVTHNGDFVGGISCRAYWNSLEIDDIFIAAEFRGEGIGSMLMKEAVKYAEKHSLRFIHLMTYSFQDTSFYKSHGFKIVGEMKNHPGNISHLWMRYDIE